MPKTDKDRLFLDLTRIESPWNVKALIDEGRFEDAVASVERFAE